MNRFKLRAPGAKLEAIEWAKRAPFGVGVQAGEEPVVEIRPLFDPSDFDPGKGV